MNRPLQLLLRHSVMQLSLVESITCGGRRCAVVVTHPTSRQAPLLHDLSAQPPQTAWITISSPPCLQKVASRLETQPPEKSGTENQAAGKGGDRPPLEKQLIVYNTLRDGLPKLFTHTMDYRIYHKQLVFINNLLGKTTNGLPAYIQQVSFLRTVGHFKFAFVRFEILNMSHDVEAARVTVRWRIIGVSGLKVMLKFWRHKLWRKEELQKQAEKWYDGISYFDIGSDGLIWRHIADKIEEDKDQLMAKSKTPLAAKLAFLAVALKPVAGDPAPDLFFSFFQ